jgi:hypothetical protein
MDTITILAARFENRAIISAHEIYQVIPPGPKNPKRAATESISRGEFPLPTLKINGRRYVRLVDLAELIDSGINNAVNNQPIKHEKRGPGRPRKLAESAP